MIIWFERILRLFRAKNMNSRIYQSISLRHSKRKARKVWKLHFDAFISVHFLHSPEAFFPRFWIIQNSHIYAIYAHKTNWKKTVIYLRKSSEAFTYLIEFSLSTSFLFERRFVCILWMKWPNAFIGHLHKCHFMHGAQSSLHPSLFFAFDHFIHSFIVSGVHI